MPIVNRAPSDTCARQPSVEREGERLREQRPFRTVPRTSALVCRQNRVIFAVREVRASFRCLTKISKLTLGSEPLHRTRMTTSGSVLRLALATTVQLRPGAESAATEDTAAANTTQSA